MLTKKQKKDYLKDANHCPYCSSSNIEGDYAEMGEAAYQVIRCMDCSKKWADCYKLTDIEEIE